MKLTIGIDVGGTNIVCGAIGPDGQVLRKLKRPTLSAEGEAAVIARMAAMVAEIQAQLDADAGTGGAWQIAAIGVGIPGLVDIERGISVLASNLKWKQVPLAQRLGQLTGYPVFIDNDVRMYVYGEAKAGAARGYSDVLGITIGTGIAAAIVQEGRLFYGFKGMAGELGHVRVPGLDTACGCGLTGCLETVASASGMAREARKALQAGRASVLRSRFATDEQLSKLSSADLSQAMDEGDELAAEIITRAGTLCGDALAAAVSLVSPQAIIVGGGGALAGERFMKPLREALFSQIIPVYREHLQVLLAEHNDDAGIIGSGLYARDRQAQL